MNHDPFDASDYPLAENRPDLVRGARGKSLDDLTLEAVDNSEALMCDFRITAQALENQSIIARASNRAKLAENFERAAELVDIPQKYLMEVYELLRPGRAVDKSELLTVAQTLRDTHDAPRMAAFIQEAAAEYERRGLFVTRY